MTNASTAGPANDIAALAAPLRLAVGRLSRRMRQESNDGYSLTQLGVLATLDREGPQSLGELAAIEQVAPPTMTKAVATLTDLGLVAKTADPDDRRVCRVALTTAGRRELARIRGRRNAWLATRLDGLAADDRAQLASVLPLLRALADDEARTGPAPP